MQAAVAAAAAMAAVVDPPALPTAPPSQRRLRRTALHLSPALAAGNPPDASDSLQQRLMAAATAPLEAAPNPLQSARRSPVFGTRGMVASTQPLATEAGLRILRAGGNAADAAVAVAAALAVTDPAMTGLGGDMFALFYHAGTKTVKGAPALSRHGALLRPPPPRHRH